MAATTRPLPIAQLARPFNQPLSATLDALVLQLEANPLRWQRRILRLCKLVAEHRAMGRMGRC